MGIPTVLDRCLQARVKNALEPEWEACFEGSSYGFRPGRGCHDAIAKTYLLACPHRRKKWVVDADIEGAFDNIDHTYLRAAIGHFPAREVVKQWLKAGYVDRGVFHETPAGTAQGSVIGPLLANVALHGLEDALGVTRRATGEIRGPRAVVRYADDFAVFCETEGDAQAVIGILADWLRLRGLTLSATKTRVVHLTDGFDFLGFTIKHHTATQTRTGYKLLITPSATAVRQLREKLRADWLAHKGASVEAVVRDLNPIIRGWANYYRVGVASRTFQSLDNWMLHREVRYATHAHPRKSWQWRQRRYWGRLHPQRQDQWVFGDKHTGSHLLKFRWFKIERHVLVRGTASRDDPALRAYWRDRDKAKATDLSPRKQRIARAQGYTCRTCGESLFNDEELHKHHIESRATGGKDSYDNLTLEHLYCHQQKHSDATAQPARAAHEPTRSWLRPWLA